jgi:hypothetical protein
MILQIKNDYFRADRINMIGLVNDDPKIVAITFKDKDFGQAYPCKTAKEAKVLLQKTVRLWKEYLEVLFPHVHL